MNAVVSGYGVWHLRFLLEFLAAWEKRPVCLTPIAYEWCSAISGVVRPRSRFRSLCRFQPRITFPTRGLSSNVEWTSSFVRPDPDLLLLIILEVGFRLVMPGRDQPAFHLDHTPHHDLVFKGAFSSGDDDIIADGVCAWVADSNHMPAGSCVHYLTERIQKDTPFSPRLRRMCIHLIERMWRSKLWVSELENIGLLNRLDVGVGEVECKHVWGGLLADVVHSPAGRDGLSIHYWRLLERFPWEWLCFRKFRPRAAKLVKSLKKAEDWEKLEAWLATAWRFDAYWYGNEDKCAANPGLERLEKATLKHLLRRPLALPKFEGLSEFGGPIHILRDPLRHICTQVRGVLLILEPLPP